MNYKKLTETVILITIAMIPFSVEWNVKGVWITTADIMMVCATLLWGWALFKGKEVQRFPLIAIIAALMFCFSLSFVHAIDKVFVAKETVKFLLLFGFFYVCVNNLTCEKTFSIIPLLVSISATIIGIWYLIGFSVGDVSPSERIWAHHHPAYQHLNALGTLFVISFPLTIFMFKVSEDGRVKIALIIGAVLQLIALFLTYSRGNWIALGIVMVLYFLYKYRLKGIVYFTVVIILPFIVLASAAPNLRLGGRFYSISDSKEASILSRKQHMQAAIELIRLYPLTGVGLGNYQEATKLFLGKGTTQMAHNIFLHYGAEAGLVSMIVLLVLIIKYYYDAYNIIKVTTENVELNEIVLFSVLSFTGIIISSQFGDAFIRGTKEYTALLLAIPYVAKGVLVRKKANSHILKYNEK